MRRIARLSLPSDMRRYLALMLLGVAEALAPWSPAVCGGSLLTDSTEPGCNVGQCNCMGYVAQCTTDYSCMQSAMAPGICLGRCELSTLGTLLYAIGAVLIFGCPLLVLVYHVRSFRTAHKTIDGDDNVADVDDADNALVGQIQHEHLLERVLLHTHVHPRNILQNVRSNGGRVYRPSGSAVGTLVRAQAQLGLFTVAPRISEENSAMDTATIGADYVMGDNVSPVRRSSVPQSPIAPPGKIENSIESYLDVTQMAHTPSAHRAVVINVHPQIYLETMTKYVLRLVLFLVGLLVIGNVIVVIAPAPFTSFSVLLTANTTNGTAATCHATDGTRCAGASWTTADLGVHTIMLHHLGLPTAPDVVRLSLHPDAGRLVLDPGVHRLGTYTLTLSSGSELVNEFTNEILTTCSCADAPACGNVRCSDVPLVGVFTKKYGATLFDMRSQSYSATLSFSSPTLVDGATFSLELQAMVNGYETAGLATKGLLGFSTIGLLVHYLYSLRRYHTRVHPSIRKLSVAHWFVMHLSLERKLLALVLFSLAVQTNPVGVVLTLPWLGPVAGAYVIFRSVWETIVYTLALGALLTIVDSYRKTNPLSFKNGAAIAFLGTRFIVVKLLLVVGFLGTRVALVVATALDYGPTTNVDLVLAMADTIMLVFGVALLVSVCSNVAAHLRRRRYSETRYQSLAFRFMSVVAYALLALLLLNVVFVSAYAVVSAFKPTFVRQTNVMTECTFTGLMYLATVAFYPPTRTSAAAIGAMPRGYVIREKRQFINTPQELSPTTPTTPVSPRFLNAPASTRMLVRGAAFRCKPISTPHHIFCLETACRLFNASRLAYYRSTLTLAVDGDDVHPSAYCNQEALARDGMHETAYLHDADTDTHCLVLQGEGKLVFAFRGTASKTNVKTDLEIALDPLPWPGADEYANPGYVHRGFVHAYNSIRDRVHDTLMSLCLEYKRRGLAPENHVQVYTTGHSLGGALATIAALDLKATFQQRIIMYNYGSPRVGCHHFAQHFDREVPLAFRIVNEGDIICGLPHSLRPKCWSRRKKFYKHVGTEVVLDGRMNGDFLIRPTFAEKNLIVDVRRKPARHMLKNYKRNLDMIVAGVLRDETAGAMGGDVHFQTSLEKALYGAFESGEVDDGIAIDVDRNTAWFDLSPKSGHRTSFLPAPSA
ncbi:hypothetical protein ACHHYP_03692 [Achlya hypogyna]|uniref:Fungal lipase-type domain-containing protein n=1 Tax=Achlya hypogyna TaxID=1202772 RepID=A0A1V9Z351_ACHHY|nr:hypothetical protein ACHHYP_03692 [Achlya hypogyna]